MPGPDGYQLERLQQLRGEIELEAEQGKHDQSHWGKFWGKIEERFHWGAGGGTFAAVSCPSSACAAGWTVINEKARMLVDIQRNGEAGGVAEYCVTPDGDVRLIMAYAQELLGLDEDEQERLFSPHPTTKETLRNIDEIIVAAKHGRTWREQRVLRTPVGATTEAE